MSSEPTHPRRNNVQNCPGLFTRLRGITIQQAPSGLFVNGGCGFQSRMDGERSGWLGYRYWMLRELVLPRGHQSSSYARILRRTPQSNNYPPRKKAAKVATRDCCSSAALPSQVQTKPSRLATAFDCAERVLCYPRTATRSLRETIENTDVERTHRETQAKDERV